MGRCARKSHGGPLEWDRAGVSPRPTEDWGPVTPLSPGLKSGSNTELALLLGTVQGWST